MSTALQKILERTGRLPSVSIVIKPLDGSPSVLLDRFLSYKFSSSVLIPIDTFSFTAVAPDDPRPFYERVKEGDIAVLYVNELPLGVGIIDTVDVEVDLEFGEKVSVVGRDLMAQLEDQSAISVDDKPIWANSATIQQVVGLLASGTRIPVSSARYQDAPKKGYLFATEPGETKLSALQRYLEPLNCLAWMSPSGQLVVGRPNMSQAPTASLIMSKTQRLSNVRSMKASRNATQIPSIVVPVWSGQESVVDRTSSEQRLLNSAPGPARLRKLNHLTSRTVVVSTPQGAGPQELSGINQITVAGGSNLLQAHAKREVARENLKELQVQAVSAAHIDELGNPYLPDRVYKVLFDRGSVDESMYLYAVDYELSEDSGQKTDLHLCRLGTIVSDIKAQ